MKLFSGFRVEISWFEVWTVESIANLCLDSLHFTLRDSFSHIFKWYSAFVSFHVISQTMPFMWILCLSHNGLPSTWWSIVYTCVFSEKYRNWFLWKWGTPLKSRGLSSSFPHLQLSVQAVEFSGLTDDLLFYGGPKMLQQWGIHFDTIR